jgi:ABC-type sugar transport system substrate-binding protein
MWCVDSGTCRERVAHAGQEAVKKGIIVISVDQELNTPGVYNVGIDQKEWAKTSAKWLAEKLGGKGSYFGTMAGALVLTLITSLLTTMQMPESVRRMVLGATLLIVISIYGRQRGLRQ